MVKVKEKKKVRETASNFNSESVFFPHEAYIIIMADNYDRRGVFY